jgi:hypothetical protein
MRLSQMSETSVSRLALPGCVEVGESGKSYLEASLQLGVWCFAGLAKLNELRRQSRVADGETPIRVINRQAPATEGGDSARGRRFNIERPNCCLGLSESRGSPSVWVWTGNYTSHTGTGLTVVS